MNRRNVKKKNNPQTKINILCYEDFECIGIFFHNIFTFSRHYWKSHRFYFRKGTSLFSSMNKAWRRIKDEKDQCSYHTKISSFQITLQNSFKRMWNNCTLHWYCCEEFPKRIKSAKMEKKIRHDFYKYNILTKEKCVFDKLIVLYQHFIVKFLF